MDGMGSDCALGNRKAMQSRHRLKLGLFGANCSSGNAVTTIKERWSGSWEDCLRLARLAEDGGLEFMLPIGRWKGYGGATNYEGSSLETVTWATGLLASTTRLTVMATVHAPMIHPIVAAKQIATADQVGKGRFGLNVVCGWNQDEFDMFGIAQRDHDARYAYAEEWLNALKAIWSERSPFDFDGRYIRLRSVLAEPKPHGGSRPLLMNAGQSPVGQDFAIRNCDAIFISTDLEDIDNTTRYVAELRQRALAAGNDLGVYTIGAMTCRRTAKEAREYVHHCLVENADWEAVDNILAMRGVTPEKVGAEKFALIRADTPKGLGGLPMIGDPDMIAESLAHLSRAGLSGVALTMIDYAADLPFFIDEVIPRLERLGVRKAAVA